MSKLSETRVNDDNLEGIGEIVTERATDVEAMNRVNSSRAKSNKGSRLRPSDRGREGESDFPSSATPNKKNVVNIIHRLDTLEAMAFTLLDAIQQLRKDVNNRDYYAPNDMQ